MSSPYEKLRRILLLELEQGCRDRAVIGGLARFLTYWSKQAEGDATRLLAPVALAPQAILAALRDYGERPAATRRTAIEALLSQLQSAPELFETPEPQPGPIPMSAPPPTESAPVESTLAKPAITPQPARAPAPDPTRLEAPVTALFGVSQVYQRRLARLELHTVRDLLYHIPRRYDDFAHLKTISQLALGDEVTVVGVVRKVEVQHVHSGREVVRLTLADSTGPVEAVWWNQGYIAKSIHVGDEIVLSGRVDEYLGHLMFSGPEWEPLRRELLHTGRLVPVYPLTEGVTGRWLRRIVRSTLNQYAPDLADPLPATILQGVGLVDLPTAIRQVHFPDNAEALEAARRRLCFEELLLLQLGILRRRQDWARQAGRPLIIPQDEIARFTQSLPFALTGAQQRAVAGILADLMRPVPMARLLQGDVGSGKTVVAVMAMLAAVRNGLQAALMAPTSVLAEQHQRTLTALLAPFIDIRCELLMGSLPAAQKRALHREIAQGAVQVVVGTHALIQETVEFRDLGLVVVDEQHRFGVSQRGALTAKADGAQPHLLVMSATPIPRTLALTMYGDLDVSVLNELPPGRQKIVTAVRDRSSRERIYAFIAAQVEQGRQAFIICPLVEESEHIAAKAVVAEHKRLQEDVFPNLSLGLLHGRMGAEDKEEVMVAFKQGRHHLLVSTAVVEVGIDVPNATVILVEGAERFGLAQLHQFRGRVGRGEHKSYCILLSDDPSEVSLERLRIMEATHDGFVLAEKDLEMRGPGDFFGVRQHGLPELKVARLTDTQMLETARAQAIGLFAQDPDLALAEHRALAQAVQRFWVAAGLS